MAQRIALDFTFPAKVEKKSPVSRQKDEAKNQPKQKVPGGKPPGTGWARRRDQTIRTPFWITD